MNQEIKPCPFCGSKDIQCWDHWEINKDYTCECRDCSCLGPIKDTYNEAIEAWNKRPREHYLETEIGTYKYDDAVKSGAFNGM